MILVHIVGGVWKRWQGSANISAARVLELLASGVWTSADLEPLGIRIATPFEAPKGQEITGDELFAMSSGVVSQIFKTQAVAMPSKQALAEYAADKRWRVETGGCPWNGRIISTDRDSQSKLIAELVALGAGLRIDSSPWKFGDGSFANLSNAAMGSVILAAQTHISGSFAYEAAVLNAISAGTISTFDEIETGDWPPTSL